MEGVMGKAAITSGSICFMAKAMASLPERRMYVASSSRLPITLACVNRALAGPGVLPHKILHRLVIQQGDVLQSMAGDEAVLADHHRQAHVGVLPDGHSLEEVVIGFLVVLGIGLNFEEYQMEDAELALVLIGSSAGTAKMAVDLLREKGVRAGLVKLRVFRPSLCPRCV